MEEGDDSGGSERSDGRSSGGSGGGSPGGGGSVGYSGDDCFLLLSRYCCLNLCLLLFLQVVTSLVVAFSILVDFLTREKEMQ